MYCAKCGCQNEDHVMYCQGCGTPLRPQAAGPNRGFTRAGTGNSVEALRELILSPLFLAATIAQTLQILFNLIIMITGVNPYAWILLNLMNDSGLSQFSNYLPNYINLIGRTSRVSTFLSNIPAILICTGLWILYANARNLMRRLETTGLTIINVIVIIQMVLFGLALIVALLSSITAAVFVSRLTYRGNPAGGIIAALIVCGLIGFLVFFYYVKILKMLGSAKSIILYGNKTCQASMFVIVITFIAGVMQCFSIISLIAAGSVIGFLAQAAGTAATILFGVLMLKFNSLEQLPQGYANAGRMRAPGRAQYDPYAKSPYPGAQQGGPQSVPQEPFGSSGRPSGTVGSPDQVVSQGIPLFIPPKPETIVIGYGEEEKKERYANEGTMVLNEEPFLPPAKLVRANDGVEVRITKPNFTIGKAYGSVDFFIEGNPAISRKHAEIIFKDNTFYVMDTNSTNHVYLDGEMIPANTPVPIRNGMKIRFADEIYVFNEER